jgi:tRNA(adenine34) deaminase
MSEALLEARKVGTRCIVPVGAGVVVQGQITGRGHNSSILASDPAAHAEIMALREAERSAQNYRLAERGTGVG